MAFFDDFTAALKQKWLQYFQLNHGWLTLQMDVESVQTPDGGRRPPSYLILGILNALEPKLAQLMLPFAKLNPDADSIIEVLELNFDPDVALGNRSPGQAPPKPAKPVAAPALVEEPSEELVEESDAFADMALGGFDTEVSEEASLETTEDYGGMALDDLDAEVGGAFAAMDLDTFDTDVSEEASLETTEDYGVGLDDLDAEAGGAFAAMDLDTFDTDVSEEAGEESLADLGNLSIDAWGEGASEESSEEAMEGFNDMSFAAFGEESSATGGDEDFDDAFADMTFEELGESDDQEDEWK